MWSVSCEKLNFKSLNFCKNFLSFLLSALFLVACGGPPQFVDEGSETPAQLVLTQDSTVLFPELINNISSLHTISVTNLSVAVPAENISFSGTLTPPIAFSGGVFPGINGTCTETLNPSQICTLEFEISPTQTQNFQSTFQLNYFDGLDDESLDISLSGSSREPYPALLTMTPSADHDFGFHAIGGFSDRTIGVSNTGEQAATGLTLSGLNTPFSIVNSTCSAILLPGEQCQWTLRFAPITDVTSNDTFNLDFFDGTQNQNQSIDLQGEGRVAGFITVVEGLNFDFGIILGGQSSQRTLNIRNTGGGNVSSLNINSLATPFSVISDNCPATLTPAQTCQAVVRYSPSSTVASQQTLEIDYFDGFSNQQSLPEFQGQGFANSLDLILISPASSPSNNDSPQIRVNNVVADLRVHLYQTSNCTVTNSNQLSVGTSSDFSLTMPEGTYEFHARVEDSDGNMTACSTDFIDFEYDNTPPNPPTGILLGSTFTSSPSLSPTLSWTASSSGDVVDYQVGISTSPAGGNGISGFTSKGNVTSSTESGMSLVECSYYYASVQSIDDVGLTSSSFNVSASPFRYDSAPPVAPSGLNELGDASISNSATVSWVAGSDACGVSHYMVAVSEDTNGNNALDASELGNAIAFTNVGNVTSHRFESQSLTNGVAHFTSIQTIDTTGRSSTTVTSQPWIVYDPSIELPDMIVWLDANDASTVIDQSGNNALSGSFTGSVNSWQDKSGSPVNHHFNALNSSSRPSYTPGDFSVVFNGASSGMTTGNHNEINTATVTQRNITVAFQTSGDIGSRQVLYEEGGNTRGMNIYIYNNRLYCGFYNDTNDGEGVQPFVSVSRPIAVNTTYFVTWVFDYSHFVDASSPDGDLRCYVDSVNFDSTTTTSRLHAHSGAVGLGVVNNQTVYEDGNTSNSGDNFLGMIFEFMIFNNVPTDADVVNVHTYLDNKWN